MPIALSRHLALHVLVNRALLLLVLVTILVSALGIDSPLAVVLLVAVLGWIDLRRRHELLFWGNLGYGVWQTTGVVATVALAGEMLFVIVLRPTIVSAVQSWR